jgi:hypothetical protein
MSKSTLQNYCFIRFGPLVAVLLTIEDQEIIVDMGEAVISEAPEDHRHQIQTDLQGIMKVASQTGNSFQSLVHAIVRLRNTRLQSTHFVSFI